MGRKVKERGSNVSTDRESAAEKSRERERIGGRVSSSIVRHGKGSVMRKVRGSKGEEAVKGRELRKGRRSRESERKGSRRG